MTIHTKIHRPSQKEKLFFLFSGAVISTPFPAMVNSTASYFLLLNLGRFDATFIVLVLIAPLVEEFAKIVPLFYRHGETERSIVTLGFLTGLGFGIAEFLLYIVALNAPIEIRFPLIFFHASVTVIAAYGIGKHRPFLFYLLAAILHAIYNATLLYGNFLISILTVLASFLIAIWLYQKTSEKPLEELCKSY